MQSLNSETAEQAKAEEMMHLGQCVQRVMDTLADNYVKKTHLRFEK